MILDSDRAVKLGEWAQPTNIKIQNRSAASVRIARSRNIAQNLGTQDCDVIGPGERDDFSDFVGELWGIGLINGCEVWIEWWNKTQAIYRSPSNWKKNQPLAPLQTSAPITAEGIIAQVISGAFLAGLGL
jgi:hypothetical protein